MALANFSGIASIPVNSNTAERDLLEEGSYVATIFRYKDTSNPKSGLGFQLTLGVNRPGEGFIFVKDFIGLHKDNKYQQSGLSKCQSLMNCLGIPNIFDIDTMVSVQDRHHLLGKKITIFVEEKSGNNGGKYNTVKGYASAVMAVLVPVMQQQQVAPPAPSYRESEETVPDHLMNDPFNDVIPY
jgi:hypothetical protein